MQGLKPFQVGKKLEKYLEQDFSCLLTRGACENIISKVFVKQGSVIP